MLVTNPMGSAAQRSSGPDRLHLWLSDGARVYDVGPFFDAETHTVASALLFAQNKLFLLHESYRKRNHIVFLTELSAQLQQIKSVLGTWKEVDKKVSTHCGSVAGGGARPGAACVAPMPTKGLVGFLSGNVTTHEWNDEYLGVNAVVTGAVETTANGLTFKGRGAWAEWPVGKQGQNQRYYFANYNFTLVAMVTIHAVPAGGSGPLSLLGVRPEGGAAAMSVSYDEQQRWQLVYGGRVLQASTGTWETGKAYQVALVVQEGRGSVYVDGYFQLASQESWKSGTSKEISHFFIGEDGGSADGERNADNVRVMVGDVLLYNRPLSAEALLDHFREPKSAAPPPSTSPKAASAHISSSSATDAASGVNADHNARTEMPPSAKAKNKHADGCGCASRVLLLLLLLLGLWVFAAL
ncbi:trans-sialidase [Trypanosoma rangeli]|uniref:Trans-sialidase n=1 Tax=Trypanosoma rangeli TaxID=5698 RepID=A0A3R7MP89_TRYRA|nr:trans-sialidase [Trypanosoma rangeli]RNF09072.1 trans-sialidase [Trypanosoma rangeli]|eukprot:RNF09072.1 trans-sialidase [Trypanosoma rangeli]